MGRYETLNAETQDMVDAILPAIAKAFHVDDVKDIVPEDIRMRCWDCDRRDHIKDQTEDDPRNWGVQFLKDLRTIARLNGGDLDAFQEMLRARVAKHEENHPWARLADIKEIKAKLENPNVQSDVDNGEDEGAQSSDDDQRYQLMQLVDAELPKGAKRRNRNIEMYEARPQPKKRKRLYRGDGGWERPEKTSGSTRARSSVALSRELSQDSGRPRTFDSPYTVDTPAPAMRARRNSSILREIEQSDVPLDVQHLQAEIDEAELQLKLTRLRIKYIEAKKRAEDAAPHSNRDSRSRASSAFFDEQ